MRRNTPTSPAKCAKFMDETLFNGEYYQQKVEFQDLHDQSFAQSIAHVDEKSSEMQQLLKREGPKVSVRIRDASPTA